MVPYPNNILIVCIYLLIFHSIYPPTHYLPPQCIPPTIFLWGLKKIVSCSLGLGKFQISLGPFILGEPNFLFGRGGSAIFFHKAINDQSCKLKNSWWQNYLFHVCILTFPPFTWEFSVWEFSVCSKCPLKLKKKKCLLLFSNNSVKVWILLDMSSNEVNY